MLFLFCSTYRTGIIYFTEVIILEQYKYLPEKLIEVIENCIYKNEITEIRIRQNKPVQFTVYGETVNICDIYLSQKEIEGILYRMCNGSVNIYDDEISEGYITFEDGSRVGIGGEYFFDRETGKYILKELHSLNIRISKSNLVFENGEMLFRDRIRGTLIIGPPHSGKTSMLRLYAERLSEKYRVAVCDERREIYSPQMNCDVLQGIKKSLAITMATRTLNPQYILCDEIGLKTEAEEILSAVNTGVFFICTAHGETLSQVLKRPNIKVLADSGIFDKYIQVYQQNKRFYVKEADYD